MRNCGIECQYYRNILDAIPYTFGIFPEQLLNQAFTRDIINKKKRRRDFYEKV